MYKTRSNDVVPVGLIVALLWFGAATNTVRGAASPVFEASHSAGNFYAYYHRTELYFGRSIPGGGMISDDDWDEFLADVVTPRFPDGFTIVRATGQYREQSGKIDREPSDVLIFLYPHKLRTASRRKIEEIRRAYINQFKQESVLRLDFRNPVDVRF